MNARAKKSGHKSTRTTPSKTDRRKSAGDPINVGVLPNLLGYNVRRAQIALWRDFSRTVGEGEIRPAVFSLLILVDGNPGIPQIALANQLDIDKATVVGLIHRLEQNQWVSRRQSSTDRRKQGIFLTAAGRRELTKLRDEMLEHEARFTRLFNAEELAQLIAFLRRIHP
jgi:DNA-binding MarR family transcriptional regulator